jgi:hypothetical protein
MTKLSKLDVFESNRLDGLVNCSGGVYFDTYHGGIHDDVFHDKFTSNSKMTVDGTTYSGDRYGI